MKLTFLSLAYVTSLSSSFGFFASCEGHESFVAKITFQSRGNFAHIISLFGATFLTLLHWFGFIF